MALRQLHTVLKRMQNNLKLAAGYQAAMDNLEIKGPHALLPHHPVVNEDKETRPVFNGSAPGEGGPSLNSVTNVWSRIQTFVPDLVDVLLDTDSIRGRHRTSVSSDTTGETGLTNHSLLVGQKRRLSRQNRGILF